LAWVSSSGWERVWMFGGPLLAAFVVIGLIRGGDFHLM
jgi:hypothetical protein